MHRELRTQITITRAVQAAIRGITFFRIITAQRAASKLIIAQVVLIQLDQQSVFNVIRIMF